MALTKSKRLKAITAIADSLEGQGWTLIDLTLAQFGLGTSSSWSSGERDYVIHFASEATDEQLQELADHFAIPGLGDPIAAPEPACWEEGRLKVFISHRSADKVQASALQMAMSPHGISSFVAHEDIQPTTEWQLEIESALSTCELLIALLYPGFRESDWCDQEIGFALGRGVPVFTIRCGLDPYGFVSQFQGFVGTGKQAGGIADEIFNAAIKHKKLQHRMAQVLVDLFVKSGSYANAAKRIAYLEQLDVWDDGFSQRIKTAAKINGQISYSYGVPERVQRLVKKWKVKA